jgi:hypothetical protein
MIKAAFGTLIIVSAVPSGRTMNPWLMRLE